MPETMDDAAIMQKIQDRYFTPHGQRYLGKGVIRPRGRLVAVRVEHGRADGEPVVLQHVMYDLFYISADGEVIQLEDLGIVAEQIVLADGVETEESLYG